MAKKLLTGLTCIGIDKFVSYDEVKVSTSNTVFPTHCDCEAEVTLKCRVRNALNHSPSKPDLRIFSRVSFIINARHGDLSSLAIEGITLEVKTLYVRSESQTKERHTCKLSQKNVDKKHPILQRNG